MKHLKIKSIGAINFMGTDSNQYRIPPPAQYYVNRLGELLRAGGAPEPAITETITEMQSHFEEALSSGRSVADIIRSLGPVDELSKAYLSAFFHNHPGKERHTPARILVERLSRPILGLSLLMLTALTIFFCLLAIALGIIGVAAAIGAPFIPPAVLDPTLRVGLPQLIVLISSLLILGIGIQALNWLRFGQSIRRLRRSHLEQWGQNHNESIPHADPESHSKHNPGTGPSQQSRDNQREHFRVIKSLVVALAGTLALVFGDPAYPEEENGRQLVMELPAAGIERVRLDSGNGDITVLPATDGQIRIELEIETDRFSNDEDRGILSWFLDSRIDDSEQLMAMFALESSVNGGNLTVRPTPRGRSRENHVRESWQLFLPAEVGLQVSAISGNIEVAGMSGGVKVDLEYGEVDVDVPSGDIDINVVNGRISIRSGTRAWRQLAVRTTVGTSRIYVEGRRMQYQNPPGPGSRVTLEGRGDDSIRLRTEVGDIEVHID